MAEAAVPDRLARFVPRAVAEWDVESPESAWRAIDATLCFVDISGFTSLSERLARLGRIGAEELTEVLNRVFGDMLDLAYARGGALLKFGGDALLLCFEGPDHAVQAACAAVEMRTALRSAVEIPTSVGRVALRMSVGIHSGLVHLFRTGRLHHELLLTGSVATRTTELEAAASAGEIVVSADTASRLPAAATGRPVEPGLLLKWRRAPVQAIGARPRLPVGAEAVAACLPEVLREHLREGATDFEHRYAGVGFVKFTGIDAYIEQHGLDAAAEVLDDLATTVQAAAHDEHVAFLASDIDRDGGKFILVSGVPTTRDDAEGRLIRALRAIVDWRGPLAVKAGANRGHVFAGVVGAEHRATYTVMGDTVNLAARLMSAAHAGEIYATAAVLERSRTLFTAESVPPFSVKGKAQPVHAFRVGDAVGTRELQLQSELPFRGRDDEFEWLTTRLRDGARFLEVTGDPGIGKSRLVQEALHASALPTVAVRGDPNGTTNPYYAFREPLRDLLGIASTPPVELASAFRAAVTAIAPELEAVLPLLGDAVGIDTGTTPEVDAIELRFRPARLATALLTLFQRALPTRWVLLVDDAQWLDAASGDLLEQLSRALSVVGWSMLVVRRAGESAPVDHAAPGIDAIALGPLGDAALRGLVVETLPAIPLRPHEIELLVHRSSGNPMFLEGLIRFTRERGNVVDVPDSLDAAITIEIDALSPRARRLLRQAAVLGTRFRPSVLRAVVGEQPGDSIAAELAALDHFLELEQGDRAVFRQAVLHDAAYEGLSYRRRQELHLRAGRVIEELADGHGDAEAADLSRHFFEGRSFERAWHYAQLAARDARDAYANIDAAAHYRRALEAARRVGAVDMHEVADTWIALGDVLEQAGMLRDALDAYRRASELVRDDEIACAGVLVKRARARERAGAFSAALHELSRAERKLVDVDEDERAFAALAIATLRAVVRQGQERAALALTLASAAAREAERLDARGELARSLGIIDWAHVVLGEPERAVHGSKIVELWESIGEPHRAAAALGNNGAVAFWRGEWSEAIDCYRRAYAAYELTGDIVNAAIQQSNIGELLVGRRQYADADEPITAAVRTLRAVGFLDGALFAEIQLGRLRRGQGEHEEAASVLTAVRDEATMLHLHSTALEAAIYLAECLVDQRRNDEALAVLDQAERAAGADAAVYGASVQLMRALALASGERVADADAAADGGINAARRMGMRYELGLLLLLHAAICEDRDRADKERAEGRALLESLEVPVPDTVSAAAISG